MDTRHLPLFNRKLLALNQNGFPTNVLLECTHRCQASCRYCYLSDKTTATDLNTEQLVAIIRKLDTDGILYLTLTGGDPFIRPDIAAILETAFSLNFFGVTVFSSGYQIGDDHIALLAAARSQIPFLQMTVFSHSEERHDRYTGVPGGLRKILSTGRKLLSKGIAIRVALPVMAFNLPTVMATITFLENEGFNVIPSITKLLTPENNSPELTYETSREFFQRVLSTIPAERLQHLYSRYEKQSDPDLDDCHLCHGLRQTVTIDHRGMLRPCASFRDIELGSYLTDATLPGLLAASTSYRHLLSLTKDDLECGTCRHRRFCRPCIGQWHTLYGTLTRPDTQSCNLAESFRTHMETTVCSTGK